MRKLLDKLAATSAILREAAIEKKAGLLGAAASSMAKHPMAAGMGVLAGGMGVMGAKAKFQQNKAKFDQAQGQQPKPPVPPGSEQ